MVQMNKLAFWKKALRITNNPPAKELDVLDMEKIISAKLPQGYKNLLFNQNGGIVNADEFEYFYKNAKFKGNIGVMLPLSLCNEYFGIKEYLNDPPEFFPKGLIPFADDGGGNLTCFDYRKTKKDLFLLVNSFYNKYTIVYRKIMQVHSL